MFQCVFTYNLIFDPMKQKGPSIRWYVQVRRQS